MASLAVILYWHPKHRRASSPRTIKPSIFRAQHDVGILLPPAGPSPAAETISAGLACPCAAPIPHPLPSIAEPSLHIDVGVVSPSSNASSVFAAQARACPEPRTNLGYDAAAMPEIDLHGAQTTTVFNLSTQIDAATAMDRCHLPQTTTTSSPLRRCPAEA
ncbi:hypothetical protein M0R45_002464 [Rubus argutus]|uniref:Uncharacterized protein n=1 Tax=Rubus argutus TaxID=59490 RepID=A0AAW1VNV7_RUBAR